MATKQQRKALQRLYNSRSRERKARRRMLREAATELLERPAPDDVAYGRLLHHLACEGDDGALRVLAICLDAIDGGCVSEEIDARMVAVIVAVHDA